MAGEKMLDCAEKCRPEELRELIDQNPTLVNYANKNGETAVWFASRNVCLDCLQVLIKKKANLNAQLLNGGVTGLWIAAANGHIEVIRTLLDGGADPNIPDSRGVTALWTATSYGFYEIVKLLLDKNSDPDKVRNNGESCLWVACKSDYKHIAEILVKKGTNLELARNDGQTPLMAAAEGGFIRIVRLLIENKAEVNTRCSNGQTALSLAACNGHNQVISELLEAGAKTLFDDADSSIACPLAQSCAYRRGSSASLLLNQVSKKQQQDAIQICEQLGYEDLIVRLQRDTRSTPYQADAPKVAQPDMGELCDKMSKAGFTRQRSRVQTAAADVVQQVYRTFFQKEPISSTNWDGFFRTIFILGSFGDGWGCNLSSVDGTIGVESDIDFTEIMPGQSFHIEGACSCPGVTADEKVVYHEGHINVKRFNVVSQPAQPTEASHVTPSMDIVYAYAACAYPKLNIVDDTDIENFPEKVVQKLRDAVKSSKCPCHLIRAGTPNMEGAQLRVSSAILERIVLRSLTTEQGQFYIILKFIVKKVLGVSNQQHQSVGLKSYHAKSILLFMLKKTPKSDWTKENFPSLLHSALSMLKDHIASKPHEREYCMPHFFLEGTVLFFKKDHSPKEAIVKHINYVIENLNRYLFEFQEQLKPLENSNYLSLHPFALFPFGFSLISDQESTTEYHNAYVHIKRTLMELINIEKPLRADFIREIDRIPNFANTTKICLKVLAYMRLNNVEAARRVLLENQDAQGRRHLSIREADIKEETRENIWRQLKGQDSLWRICCRMGAGTIDSIKFVREHDASSRIICQACFPSVLPFHERRVYLNFAVLLFLLRLRFCDNRDEVLANFRKDVRSDFRSADFEELYIIALMTEDISEAKEMLKEMLKRYDKRHKKTDEVIRSILMRSDGASKQSSDEKSPELGKLRIQHDMDSEICLLKFIRLSKL